RLADDAIVVIKGRLDLREDEPKLVVMEVERPQLVIDGGPPMSLRLPVEALDRGTVAQLKEPLVAHPGPSPVLLRIGTKQLRLPQGFNVDDSNGLCAELRLLLGPDCLDQA